MKLSDLPTRFTIPFADDAGAGYLTYPIPVPSQIGISNGRASLTDGFPPLNFLPVGAGGVPPFGQDMNGLLKQVTLWNRWQGAGGLTTYNSAFSSAVGGYPQGAIISSSTPGRVWVCTEDDNTADPDTGGSGWLSLNNYGVRADIAVLGWSDTPPVSPSNGDLWIVGASPTGAWATHAAAIAQYLAGAWIFQTPPAGLQAQYWSARQIVLRFDGATWAEDLATEDGPGRTEFATVAEVLSRTGDGVLRASLLGAALAGNSVVRISPGTANWTVPAGVYRISVDLLGGGGGGGGSGGAGIGSSGGGGGGWSTKAFNVTPGDIYSLTVGDGGSGPGGGIAGTAGGTTSFDSVFSATGGGGGPVSVSLGGASGVGIGGDVNVFGGGGKTPTSISGGIGGGGYYGDGGIGGPGIGGNGAPRGAGGAGGFNNARGGDGVPGLIIIRY